MPVVLEPLCRCLEVDEIPATVFRMAFSKYESTILTELWKYCSVGLRPPPICTVCSAIESGVASSTGFAPSA